MPKDHYKIKREKRLIRHRRVRSRVFGITRPRLAVFRSGEHIYAQIIDDSVRRTIVAASDLDIKKSKKTDRAIEVGKRIAVKALEKGVVEVNFDRGGFKYHGRVKALADAAREAGLKF